MFTKVIVLACVLAVAFAAPLYSEDPRNMKMLWEGFKSKFAKAYSTFEEEENRFRIFIDNVKMADYRNAQELKHGGNAVHGVTHLSDLSAVEFAANYLTADSSKKTGAGALKAEITSEPVASMGLVDWTGKYTTAVKDQVNNLYYFLI